MHSKATINKNKPNGGECRRRSLDTGVEWSRVDWSEIAGQTNIMHSVEQKSNEYSIDAATSNSGTLSYYTGKKNR